MQCPNCDSQMDVRAAFPTNRSTIYMDAICRACGAIYKGQLLKIGYVAGTQDGNKQTKRVLGVSA